MEEIGLKDLPSILSPTVIKVEAGASVLLTKYNRPAAVLVNVDFYEKAAVTVQETANALIQARRGPRSLGEVCKGAPALLRSCELAHRLILLLDQAKERS